MRTARLALVALAALHVSCAEEPFDPPRATVRGQSSLALRAADELVVDVAPNGDSLVARETPPLPDSDIDRLLTVRWLSAGGARPWRFDGEEILDARFIARGAAVLVITRDHRLVRVDHPFERDAAVVEVDRDVLGPLSLDREARSVVYVRGEMPEYQLVRADVQRAIPQAIAPTLVPAWCPTIVPDSDEVLVVASPEGTPALFRVREGRAPEALSLPAETPLPTGPAAAVIVDRTMHYQSDGAVVSLSLDRLTHRSRPGASLPVLSADRARVLVHDGTRVAELAP